MSDLNKIINEQRERISHLERIKLEYDSVLSPVLDYCRERNIGKPGKSMTSSLLAEHSEQRERIAELERCLAEVEGELEAERMMSMKRFIETGRANRFAIEQQFKVVSDLLGDYLKQDYPHYCMSKLAKNKIVELRQQLNGGSDA